LQYLQYLQYSQYLEYLQYLQYFQYLQYSQYFQYLQYLHYLQYMQYWVRSALVEHLPAFDLFHQNRIFIIGKSIWNIQHAISDTIGIKMTL